MKTYTVTLETLTPVRVGAGDEHQLSPLMEYVYDADAGQVHMIDTDRLHTLLMEDMDIFEEFVESVRRRTRTSEREDGRHLRRFVEQRLGVPLEEVVRFTVPATGSISGLIQSTIKNGLHPYIPGSSVKGAIRTATLYKLLDREKPHPAWQKFVDMISRGKPPRANYYKTLEGEVFDMMTTTRQGKRIPSIEKDPFRFVSISDTRPLNPSSLMIGAVGRYKLAHPDGSFLAFPQHLLDIPCELIPKGVKTTFTIGLTEAPETVIPFLQKPDIHQLFNVLNDFSYAILARELDALDAVFDRHDDRYDEPPQDLLKVKEFYESLHQRIDGAPKTEAYIRLGSGKTYFDQTIGLIAENQGKGFLLRLIKELKLTRKARELEDPLGFPRTRSFLCDKNQHIIAPLGWIRCTLT